MKASTVSAKIRWRKRSAFSIALFVACSGATNAVYSAPGGPANQATSRSEGTHPVHVQIAIGSRTMEATLGDNPAAQDFAAQLPVTVILRDLSDAEKVSGALPKPLSQDGARRTDAGSPGDIAYYAPWGNIAFYRGRGPDAAGVIKIGRITSGVEALNQSGTVRATISRSDEH